MAISKTKKVEVVDFLRTKVVPSASAVFVNFHGLPVGKTTALRKQLKAAGLAMVVAKKSLIRRALAETKIPGDLPELDGEVALVYVPPNGAADALAPAREAHKFARGSGKDKEKLELIKLLGGVFDGRYVDASFANQLAVIPSRPELYGQLLSLLLSPVRRLLLTLQAIKV